MTTHRNAILILLACLVAFVPANLHAAAPNIRSRQFSTHNGLSDNTVRQIYQDSRGYVWLATFNGLSRYDGYNLVKYSTSGDGMPMQESQIRKMFEDSHGYLWIIAYNDIISCLDLKSDRFVDICPENDALEFYRYAEEFDDGTVWLWGENGARRITYEGRRIISEKIDSKSRGLPSDNVLRIGCDRIGRAFISTDKGLGMLEPESAEIISIDQERQYQWFCATEDAMLMVAGNGDVMMADSSGRLSGIGTMKGILSRSDLPGEYCSDNKWHITSTRGGVDVDLNTFEMSPTPSGLDVISGKVITDSCGDVWLHNESGSLHYRAKGSSEVRRLRMIPESIMKLIDMERYSIARDRHGRAWITTAENGLFIYEPSTGKLEHITTAGDNYRILPSNNLLSATTDREGNIWIGTDHAGAVMLKPNDNNVTPLQIPGSKDREISVRMIKKLPDGSIAVSARDGNIYRYASDLSSYKVMPRGSLIYDMTFDGQGNLWEASRNQGLLLNGDSPENFPGTTSKSLFAVHCDSRGHIWAGTFGSGLDVMIPDNSGKGYHKLNFLNSSYALRRIRAIFEDSSGHIWAATNAGAYRFQPDSLINGKADGILFNTENKVLKSNEVHCIEQDSQGRIWIGTAGSGIAVLDFSMNHNRPKVIHVDEDSGMGHNNVQAFVKQGDEYIWATTLYGASRINVSNLDVESFVFLSDPIANIHNANSAVLTENNRLLLGTTQGAYTVDLDKLDTYQAVSPIVITSFKVNGENRNFNATATSGNSSDKVRTIILPHDSNNLDFNFSTFDFEWPKQTRFRYRLTPVDRQWSEATVNNSFTLKNMQPGEYTLIVETCESNGMKSQEFRCRIIIEKPWWASSWAKVMYLLFFISGTVLAIWVIRRINRLHNKVKVEEQLTDYKLEFFTNISHEFRTPLTLIQVSIEKLHEKIYTLKRDNPGVSIGGIITPIVALEKNSRRMSRLIEELLTFRKMEKNKFVLFPEPTEIMGFLNEIHDNFKDEAVSKKMEFRFEKSNNEFMMNIDRGAIDKIANNLLSNALKYTREGGRVLFTVNVSENEKRLRIQVIDNGVGIDPDKREQLFSRFMQSAMSRNSIGVGLHLTFGLVELHKGEITHSDNPGGGSIFTVIIPTDLPAAEGRLQEGIGQLSFDSLFKEDAPETEEVERKPDGSIRRMLIIDDDADIRSFLKNEFSKYFDILTASDGRSGLEAARSNDINLIICDVMMPDMSGFEVTRLLKEDFATSHIPIIQLTALNNDEQMMEGLASGADAYMSKPFNLRHLKIRVAKLIEQRENLFSKFSANPTMTRPQLPMGDKDERFAEKLAVTVERELDNSEFSVDDFAAEMAMGRTIFFRKVKGVTGYAPKEYIRVMRMKKAAELLLSTDLTISEISFQVGISDPSYFNKCFKAQFGKAPSVYQRENTALPDSPPASTKSTV